MLVSCDFIGVTVVNNNLLRLHLPNGDAIHVEIARATLNGKVVRLEPEGFVSLDDYDSTGMEG